MFAISDLWFPVWGSLSYLHAFLQTIESWIFFLVCFCFKFFAQDIFGDLLSLPLTHPRFPFHIHPTPYYFTLKVKNENRNCGVNFVLDNYSWACCLTWSVIATLCVTSENLFFLPKQLSITKTIFIRDETIHLLLFSRLGFCQL